MDPIPRLLEGLSKAPLMKHTREICRYERLSGSEDERKALDYVSRELRKSGFKVHAYEFESYVGFPEWATLSVASRRKYYRGTTPALSRSTPLRGLKGVLVDVGDGRSLVKEEEKKEIRGKITLIDGLCNPRLIKLAEENGSIAQVFINDRYAHEGIASMVWGTPTPKTSKELPRTPCISITRQEGAELRRLISKGDVVEVVIKTKVLNEWRRVPVVTADLGVKGGDFVLLSGHIDSWHLGAMDNAGANSLMIVVGKVLSEHMEVMKRGLRIAFWSGHSQGRYSGSAWYADRFWQELYENCVAHVNVDSVGAVGASDLTEQQVMKEAEKFIVGAVLELTGKKASGVRFSRAGDQSFWGIGVTSMLCELSQQPVEKRKDDLTPWGWWWHTPRDTIDKIDPECLLRDAKVYLLIVGRLCSAEVLPFNFEATVKEMEEALNELFNPGNGRVDLKRQVREVGTLRRLIRDFEKESERKTVTSERARIINATLKRLGRLLIPINYTIAGPFDQDFTISTGPLPGLQSTAKLQEMDPSTDEFRFLATSLQREANRTLHALLEAQYLVEVAKAELRATN